MVGGRVDRTGFVGAGGEGGGELLSVHRSDGHLVRQERPPLPEGVGEVRHDVELEDGRVRLQVDGDVLHLGGQGLLAVGGDDEETLRLHVVER